MEDEGIAMAVERGLVENSFSADVASNGEEG